MIVRRFVAKYFGPYVFVAASDSAKIKLRKNNLSAAEFLRPFGNFTDKNKIP
jgi:hypothetical protein